MIKVVDGVLQFLEHHLLFGAFVANVGELPRHQRGGLVTLVAGSDRAATQPVPVPSLGAALRRAQRLRHTELFLTVPAVAHGVGQPIDSFCGFTVARQDRLDGLHICRIRRTGQASIGMIGVDHPPLLVGDKRAFGMGVDKGAGKWISRRFRHDVDKADDRGNQEEDPDHRKHAKNSEHQLIVEPVLEQEKHH